MPLTDIQIERYSRQIILPEIGGLGQERLLRSNVALVGTGPLAAAILPYLAGGGIGGLHVRPVAGEDPSAATRLAERAEQINPDVVAGVGPIVDETEAAGVACEMICETSGRHEVVGAVVRGARRAGTPVIAAAATASRGWISAAKTSEDRGGCVLCGWLEGSRGGSGATSNPLAPTVVGAVAALSASWIIQAALGLERVSRPEWLRYEAETMTLERYEITARENCPVCGTRKGPCHPIQDS